jgi:glycosyltransferase involved in cell wall biosynthesis
MRILLNAWASLPGVGRRGDMGVHREIRALSRQYPDIEFLEIESILVALFRNSTFVLTRLLARTGHWWLAIAPLRCLACSTYLPDSVVRRCHPDVVFSHGHAPVFGGPWSAPVVVQTHLPDRHLYPPQIAERRMHEDALNIAWMMRRITTIVTSTPGSARRIAAAAPEKADRIVQIPIYMPYLEAVDEATVRARNTCDGPIQVLFVGHDAIRKGLPQLAGACQLLPVQIKKRLQLVVVSTFRDGTVNGLPATTRVLRNVPPPELGDLMARSHIFAFPTAGDTFGRVLIEAMAYGCAVIGPRQDPQDWMLDYGGAGALVNPLDAAAIAEELRRLIADRAARTRLAMCGRHRFLASFHHSGVGAQYRRAFEDAIRLHQPDGAHQAGTPITQPCART